MARYKLTADGDLFENKDLGSFSSMVEAAEKAEKCEEDDSLIGYEFVLEDTLLHVEYFYSEGEWHRVMK